MKFIRLLAFTLTAGLSTLFLSCFIYIDGNSDITASERSMASFNKVSAAGPTEVNLHHSDEYRVIINVDSNLLNIVDIKVRDKTLTIGTKSSKNNRSYSFTKFIVDVYSPEIIEVSFAGSGNVNAADTITASNFKAIIAGSGTFTAEIENETFTLETAGSGNTDVSGSTGTLKLKIAGSGRINAFDLEAVKAEADISGSGLAKITVSEHIKARITGSGEIIYRGSPEVDSTIIGSGKIRADY